MTKRSLSDWASIAEIIGAAAVIASLLYVGYEIQRNTKVGLATNRQAIAARAQELALYSAETNIYGILFDPDRLDSELTVSETNHVIAYIGALLRTSEEAFLLYRDGMLEEEYWATRAGVLLAALHQLLRGRSTLTHEMLGSTRRTSSNGPTAHWSRSTGVTLTD